MAGNRQPLPPRLVDDLAGHHHPRPEQAACLDAVPPVVDHRVTGHLADRGEAVGQVELRRDPLVAEAVYVHVGEPGDQELSGQVYRGGVAGDRHVAADPDDPVATDQHGLIAVATAVRDVDHGDVGQRGDPGGLLAAGQRFDQSGRGAGGEGAPGNHCGADGSTDKELTS
jgi:hypothetical protein